LKISPALPHGLKSFAARCPIQELLDFVGIIKKPMELPFSRF
jgi:hypothetical protein